MTSFYQQFNTTGNASVGNQIGQVSGGLHQGAGVYAAAAGDLAGGLDRLRDTLNQAHRRGEIDAATLADAQHELDAAEAALPATDEQQRGQARRALRKLSGLLSGVAGFGAQVATVLSTFEGIGA
ncbi:hypothetical protein QLQ12_36615 [Actinoplanes sp. NEAU-A12]|uniref:Uncharacterized protein n=2 Tax=Actinoplanes sandaracinus TaxID=3045177 RepID=A0ABT6WWN5_9ACTN|nr:hypothetical protein [Actinoplanes sandaracinus]